VNQFSNPLAGESQFFSEGGLGKGETQVVIHYVDNAARNPV
jgi:hypothetical protein